MNVSTRLTLRLAVPAIALVALALSGEPAPTFDDAVFAAAPGSTSMELACEETPVHEVEVAEVAEQRSRTAMRLRWAVTLPDSSRPLSIRVLP